MGILQSVPKIRESKRAKRERKSRVKAKGRAITTEEFERMLMVTPALVGEEYAPEWLHYLDGLWTSGSRLRESANLWWGRLHPVLTGKRPMLWIPGELEKGRQNRLIAMAPEFAELLMETPEHLRHGPIFNLRRRGENSGRLAASGIGENMTEIGKKAGVKVWTHPKTGKVKFATAHDLRRSFGFRWASRVIPPVLMEMMRHENIETTMQFYVSRDAQATADVIWKAYEQNTSGNSLGNTSPESAGILQDSDNPAGF